MLNNLKIETLISISVLSKMIFMSGKLKQKEETDWDQDIWPNKPQIVAIITFSLGMFCIILIYFCVNNKYIHDLSTQEAVFFVLEHAAVTLMIIGIIAWIYETYFRIQLLNHIKRFFQLSFNDFCKNIQENVCKQVNPGIIEIAEIRQNHEAYNRWINDKKEWVFFSGRAVLTRIEGDLKKNQQEGVVPTFIKKLETNSKIRILTFDPRSDLIERISKDEERSYDDVLNDIVKSIGLIHSLYEETLKLNYERLDGSIIIELYDLMNDFSYVHVKSIGEKKKYSKMLLGLYYNYQIGYNSPLYEVFDPSTKKFFAEYIHKVFIEVKKSWLLRMEPGKKPQFNNVLYQDIYKHIETIITDKKVQLNYKLPEPFP